MTATPRLARLLAVGVCAAAVAWAAPVAAAGEASPPPPAGSALAAAPVAAAAAAVPCPSRGLALGDGPLPVGQGAADFGSIPQTCAGTDGALGVRGSLLVAADAPDFYGSVAAAGGARLRYALAPRWALTFAADAATLRFVQNAVVSSTAVDAGPATLGLARTLVARDRAALSLFARALLPLDSARSGWATGGDAGLSFLGRSARRPWLGAQGGAVVGAPVTVAGGQAHPAMRAALVAEAWASGARLAGTLGVFARGQLAPQLDRSSAFGLRTGGRVAWRSGLSLSAVVELPVVGGDRTDLVLALAVAYAPRRD